MRLVFFACSEGASRAIEEADIAVHKVVELPCSGRTDLADILRELRAGADAVAVLGCLEGNCRYRVGNIEAKKRVERARAILDWLKLGGGRVEMFNVASNQAWKVKEIVDEMEARVKRLGPNPLGEEK